ncbi:MAG: GGDEF domain-containing phosphodiesterase [Treponema sp.]|nr:GGDEF domain-containing phosphodiesterase [Treponema sp.]
MTSLELIFYVLASMVWLFLLILFINLSRVSVANKFFYSLPNAMALFTIPIYSLFITARSVFWATLYDGIYFICTDLLCFVMLLYILCYSSRQKLIKPAVFILTPLLLIDSVSLIANAWTKHTFELTRALLPNGNPFWSCAFTPLHYIHLAFCYSMLSFAIFFLIKSIVSEPSFYKTKFIAILAAFAVVVCANAFCYTRDLAIDFSVLLYPILGIFIYYYSAYSAPRQLLTHSLTNVNESIDDAILYFDINDECIYKNSKGVELFNKDGVFSKEKALEFLLHARGKLQAKKDSAPIEFFTINGEERQFEIESEDVYYGYNLIGSYLKLSDKTDEINKYLTQKFLATHDELTGAYTREHFFKICDEKIRENKDTQYLMISSNIRQFKLLNELFGEEIGNKILISMTRAAKTLAIHESVLGRVGDDRFGLLVQKEYFTEDLVTSFLQAPQEFLKDSMYKLNLCVGICEARDNESAQLLYDKTQLAIKKICDDYQKHIAYYNSDLMDSLLREKQVTADFEKALEDGQIQMYLQPFFNADGEVMGGEALARWDHPQRGLLIPEMFIPILENSGLIHKLDSYIWECAAKKLESWQAQGKDSIYISVNVSSKDILYIDIADTFKQLLLRHSFNPQNLKIEFTEGALTKDISVATELFSQLKQLGFEIGIDDFGHGYSSLNFLKDINADILKMDMVLVQQTENEERVKVILKFIVQISNALGMQLISEGVETEDQLKTLKSLGFPYFQGYYFSKPLTVKDFEEKYLV